MYSPALWVVSPASPISNTQNSCIHSPIHFTVGSLDTCACSLIWKKNSLVYTFIQNLNAGLTSQPCACSQTCSLSQPQWLNTIKNTILPLCPVSRSPLCSYFPTSQDKGNFHFCIACYFVCINLGFDFFFSTPSLEVRMYWQETDSHGGEDVLTGDWQPCHLGAFLWSKIPLRTEQSSEDARPSSAVSGHRPGVSKLLLPVGQSQSAASLCKQKFADAVILTVYCLWFPCSPG